jgi:hypothetical protein
MAKAGHSLSKTDNNNNFIKQNDSEIMKLLNPHKPRVEDTHTRDTYLIRNDLLERLNKVAAKQSKGFKMRLINYLLEEGLKSLESGEEIK